MSDISTNKIEFEAYDLFLKHLRTDKGIRFEADISQDQYEKVYTIPALPGGIYRITIEPIRSEE